MFGCRAACILGGCFVSLAALSSATGQTGTVQPAFQQSACDLPGLSPEVAPRVQCGTVSVPRSYGQPGSGVFKLAVVVVKSAQHPALPDPVVYISGGPGSPLTKYTERQALGVARWNVVGNSYGTTVAMTLMARHPEAIRSAVLDSVYPPDMVLPPWSARVAAARTAFFRVCEQDPACAASFPDLAEQYRQTLERLSHTPLTVSVPTAMHQPDNKAPLTASLFEMVVAIRLYYSENYPDLPRLIATVHDGKAEDFAAALAAVLSAAADTNPAAHIAVECRDRPHLREPAGAEADPLDRIVDQGICTGWSELGPPPIIPTGTNIPTLVLAGQFDPNASPLLSRHIAELIGDRARWVEFPLIGHNVWHISPCATTLVAAFIAQPGKALDISCAQQPKPIRFLPR